MAKTARIVEIFITEFRFPERRRSLVEHFRVQFIYFRKHELFVARSGQNRVEAEHIHRKACSHGGFGIFVFLDKSRYFLAVATLDFTKNGERVYENARFTVISVVTESFEQFSFFIVKNGIYIFVERRTYTCVSRSVLSEIFQRFYKIAERIREQKRKRSLSSLVRLVRAVERVFPFVKIPELPAELIENASVKPFYKLFRKIRKKRKFAFYEIFVFRVVKIFVNLLEESKTERRYGQIETCGVA